MDIQAQLQGFITEFTNKPQVGDTPQNIGECVGLIECWLDKLGLPHIWGNAIDLLTNADSTHYAVILNTPENFPMPGDIAVLGEPYGQGVDETGKQVFYGHTGVVVLADINTTTLFQANDPLHSTPHQTTYNYAHVKGWIHVLVAPQQVAPSVQAVDSHGLDLRNPESLQVALDTWYEVANGKYVTLAEYNTLQGQLTQTQEKLTQTAQDVLDAKKQLVSVMNANNTVHGMLQEKNNEDISIVQSSIDATKQLKELQDMATEAAKILGVEKPVTGDILNRLLLIKDLADKQLRAMQYRQSKPVQAIVKTAGSIWDSFMRIINGTQLEKEVNIS